jgi:hypothetical protein
VPDGGGFMTYQIIIALIGVFAALGGTTAGGLISYFTNKNLNEKNWRRSLIKEEISEKRQLYSEFLAECYRIKMESVKKEFKISLDNLSVIYKYYSRITLVSDEPVVRYAKDLLDHILSVLSDETAKNEFISSVDSFVDNVKKEIDRLCGLN